MPRYTKVDVNYGVRVPQKLTNVNKGVRGNVNILKNCLTAGRDTLPVIFSLHFIIGNIVNFSRSPTKYGNYKIYDDIYSVDKFEKSSIHINTIKYFAMLGFTII